MSLVTSPSGLKLKVDGRSNLGSYDFIWGVGTIAPGFGGSHPDRRERPGLHVPELVQSSSRIANRHRRLKAWPPVDIA